MLGTKVAAACFWFQGGGAGVVGPVCEVQAKERGQGGGDSGAGAERVKDGRGWRLWGWEKEEGLVAAEAGCGLGHPVLRLCACAARLCVCCLVCAASCPDVDPLGTEGWGDNRKRRQLLGRSSVGRDADADAVITGGAAAAAAAAARHTAFHRACSCSTLQFLPPKCHNL